MNCPKCGSETKSEKLLSGDGDGSTVKLHYCINEECEVNCVETWSALQLCGHEEKVK